MSASGEQATPARGFEDRNRPRNATNDTPRRYVRHNLNDDAFPIQESYVDWETHPERMDGVTGRNQDPGSGSWQATQLPATKSLPEGRCQFETLNDYAACRTIEKLWPSSEVAQGPKLRTRVKVSASCSS